MEKLLLLITIMLCATQISAQELEKDQINIHAGTTISNLRYVLEGTQKDSSPRIGFQIGLSYERLISKTKPLHFETGLYYVLKGAKLNNESDFTEEINQTQLIIPALVHYYFGKKEIFSLYGGLYYSFGMAGTSHFLNNSRTRLTEVETYGNYSPRTKSDVGVRLGVGLNLNKVVIKAGYDIGLINMFKASVMNPDTSMYSNSITITLGFKL